MPLNIDTSVYDKIQPLSAFKQAADDRALSNRIKSAQVTETEDMMKAKATSRALSMATPENWQMIRPKLVEQGIPDQLIPKEFNPQWSQKAIQGMAGKFGLDSGTAAPSNVREYEYYNQLPDAEKEAFLNMKRANKTINLGGSQAVLDQQGGISAQYPVTPKPEQMPEFKAAQAQAVSDVDLGMKPQIEGATAAAKEIGKEEGISQASLQSQKSKLPELKQVVSELNELGKAATYTSAGRIKDTVMRETGMDVPDAAVARTKYIAMVDNQVLPLLRDTFGAQFTVAEGQSLRDTLGDPNKSPTEKEAVLEAFIKQKERNVGALEAQLSNESLPPSLPPQPEIDIDAELQAINDELRGLNGQ